jgi:hypothetical protein
MSTGAIGFDTPMIHSGGFASPGNRGSDTEMYGISGGEMN